MRIKMQVNNVNQLKGLAEAFVKAINPPMIILLKGDLGSGKTTFVKEIVAALDCKDMVTSPTYTLLNTYQAEFPIYHFDMYRLSSAEEARDVGFEEYFDKSRLDGICFVEWPENVEGLIKDVDYIISIKKDGIHHRTIIIEGK